MSPRLNEIRGFAHPIHQSSSSAKADDPVFRGFTVHLKGRGVLDTRFRGYDDGGCGGQIAQ
jgi:hypothetical protein